MDGFFCFMELGTEEYGYALPTTTVYSMLPEFWHTMTEVGFF